MLLVCLAALAAVVVFAPPGHRHDPATVNTAHAAAALKSGVWPAAVRWRDDGRTDRDGDGRGEYPLLAELTATTDNGAPAYLSAAFAGEAVRGFRFATWLPDGHGGALRSTVDRGASAAAIDAQEQRWVGYAWPEASDSGRRMFAILPDGILREAAWTGTPPDWRAVFGGADWDAAPVWQPYVR